MDYQGNPNKSRDEKKPDKQIEKVVTGEVIQKPKSIGRKFRDIFLGGDLKNAGRYVTGDVILPAIRDLLVDTTRRGVERLVYGESMYRRRPSEYRPQISYNNPIYRGTPRDPRELRPRLPDQSHPYRQEKRERDDIILERREDAELVVERLIDIIETYEVASLADLYELLGWQSSHVDNKWGWTQLKSVEIRQVRDGYLIDLPPLEAV